MNISVRKYCFCNYNDESQKCNYDEKTCIKDEFAACFRAVRQEFNEETKTFELIHLFGCAPLEKGSNGSHLTCNAWRFAHSSPKSIFCCYEGNYCNKHLTIPSFPLIERSTKKVFLMKTKTLFCFLVEYSTSYSSIYTLESFFFTFFGFLIGLCLIILFAIPLIRKKNKLIKRNLNKGGGKKKKKK
uniref:Activin types I and II receptor domain-containing protein n=1 Tax=Meloidogyne enterolobii TaxID=390850 RepID=A0A6V7VS69_MELEN|nr:unnamed protein product [Meloidogyne enterolobii]